jgi:hypothetical protein
MAENDEQFEPIPELNEQDDRIDWKAEALKAQGIAKRNKTKFDKATGTIGELKAQLAKNPLKPGEKQGFDYAEKAYLLANGLKSDEFAVIEEAMKSTGKSIDDVLGSKWFQNDLKERREVAASKAALPDGSGRSGQTTRDTVDYWLAKGELPPADQVELRRKVVNAKIKAAQKSHFTDHPVV